jgi:sulfoxide reductase catalytic subunit YedY
MEPIPSSEITPEHIYLSRRRFMTGLGAVATGAVLAGCGVREAILADIGASQRVVLNPAEPPTDVPPPTETLAPGATRPPATATSAAPKNRVDELGDPANSYQDITNFNNYYEFTTDKQAVAGAAKDFKTTPWTVRVGGLVNRPGEFGIDDLIKAFPPEERVYRHRCVEGWSLVIPWLGFPLAHLLSQVQPQAAAKFVRFESVLDPADMPGQNDPTYKWPYVEGLRLDEAMNPLALLVTGLYGKHLVPQNGAPLRLALPWKYGFKSVKAIVKIDLVADMPRSLWMNAAPDEYGFYANVNPNVPHPRWTQASERRIGEPNRRRTLMFNGYEQEVAYLYRGMDLKANF